MGISNPTQQTPKNANFPTGTPAELEQMGEDLSRVFSCAVTQKTESGIPIVRGCPHAARCSKFFRNEKIGAFGPKSSKAGSAGEGPENVPFSIETAEGDEMESWIPCHAFFGSLYGRMMASRDPDTDTGERVRILGKAGEAKVLVSTTLPRTPGSTTDMVLITTNEVVTVPKHPRPFELDPRWRLKRARQVEEADAVLDEVLGDSAAADLPEGRIDGEEVTASALPMRKRGK